MKLYSHNGIEYVFGSEQQAELEDTLVREYEKYYYFCDEEGKRKTDIISRVSVNSLKIERVVDGFLDTGIYEPEEVGFLLAWKTGGIKHKASQDKQRITITDADIFQDKWKAPDTVAAGHFQCQRDGFEEFCKGIVGIAKDHYKSSKTDAQVLREILNERDRCKVNKLGPVYTLTILYFITKNNSPIFDQYAYKAIRAIYHEKKPSEIWFAGPSFEQKGENENDATYIDRRVNYMLNIVNDYKWYIERVFGKSRIQRNVDRALWVYGHSQAINEKKADGNS